MKKAFATTDEVAKAVGVSRPTVVRMIREGSIPAVRVGKKRYSVPISWLEELEKKAFGRILTPRTEVSIEKKPMPEMPLLINSTLKPSLVNALMRNGMLTDEDLASRTLTQLRRTDGIGEASLRQIKAYLKSKGMKNKDGHADRLQERLENLRKARAVKIAKGNREKAKLLFGITV